MKDKQILSAEVMNEYNEKVRDDSLFKTFQLTDRDAQFVNPRVNPVRFDKAVMTHQAEVIDYWNDYESDRY